jgi:hypothetical protein
MDDFSFEGSELIEIKLSTNYPNTRMNAIGGIANRSGMHRIAFPLKCLFCDIRLDLKHPVRTNFDHAAWKNVNDPAGYTDSANGTNRIAGTFVGWASSEWQVTVCVGVLLSAVFGVARCLF